MRPIAANAALRAVQITVRSASSFATRIEVAPASSHIDTTCSKRVSHSASEPSSSTTSAAPASVG